MAGTGPDPIAGWSRPALTSLGRLPSLTARSSFKKLSIVARPGSNLRMASSAACDQAHARSTMYCQECPWPAAVIVYRHSTIRSPAPAMTKNPGCSRQDLTTAQKLMRKMRKKRRSTCRARLHADGGSGDGYREACRISAHRHANDLKGDGSDIRLHTLCGCQTRPSDRRPPKPFGARGLKPPIIRPPNHALDRDFDPGDAHDIERIHLAAPTRRRRGPRPD